MASDNINVTVIHVMWREERPLNAGTHQRVHLSNLVSTLWSGGAAIGHPH